MITALKNTLIKFKNNFSLYFIITGVFVIVVNYLFQTLVGNIIKNILITYHYDEVTVDTILKALTNPIVLIFIIFIIILTIFCVLLTLVIYFSIWLKPQEYTNQNIFIIIKNSLKNILK